MNVNMRLWAVFERTVIVGASGPATVTDRQVALCASADIAAAEVARRSRDMASHRGIGVPTFYLAESGDIIGLGDMRTPRRESFAEGFRAGYQEATVNWTGLDGCLAHALREWDMENPA